MAGPSYYTNWRSITNGYWDNPYTWDRDCWNMGSGDYLTCDSGTAYSPQGSFSAFCIFKTYETLNYSGTSPFLYKQADWDLDAKEIKEELGSGLYDDKYYYGVRSLIEGLTNTTLTNRQVYGPYVTYGGGSDERVYPLVVGGAWSDTITTMAITYNDVTKLATVYLKWSSNDYSQSWTMTGTPTGSSNALQIGNGFTGKMYRVGYFDDVVLTEDNIDNIRANTHDLIALNTLVTSLGATLYIDFSQDVTSTYTPEIGSSTFTVTGTPSGPSYPVNGTNNIVISENTEVRVNKPFTFGYSTGVPSESWVYIVGSYEYDGPSYRRLTQSQYYEYDKITTYTDSGVGYSYQKGYGLQITNCGLRIYGDLILENSQTADEITYEMGGTIYLLGGYLRILDSNDAAIPANKKVTLKFLDAARLYCLGGGYQFKGAESYHMANSTSQRALMTNAPTRGSDKTITLDTAVDWEVGDEIWFGQGGDKTKHLFSPNGGYLIYITTAITAGTDVTFSTGSNAIDFWEVGDELVLVDTDNEAYNEIVTIKQKNSNYEYVADFTYNHNSNKARLEKWGVEKAIIKTKIDANTYTVDLTYNHMVGDFVINGERNVVITGDPANGYNFRVNRNKTNQGRRRISSWDNDKKKLTWNTDIYYDHVDVEFDWVKFEHGGATTGTDSAGVITFSSDAFPIQNGQVSVTNSTFDTAYDSGAGVFSSESYVINFQVTDNITDEIHIYDHSYMWGPRHDDGSLRFGHVSFIGSPLYKLAGDFSNLVRSAMFLHIESIWFCEVQPIANAQHKMLQVARVVVDSCLCTLSATTCIEILDIYDTYDRSALIQLNNCKFYHIPSEVIHIHHWGVGLEIANTEIYDTVWSGIYVGNTANNYIRLYNTSFDDCNRSGLGYYGCIVIGPYDSFIGMKILVDGCTFGIYEPNSTSALILSSSPTAATPYRILLRNCIFKEPYDPGLPNAFWNETLMWICDAQAVKNNDQRRKWHSETSLEIVNPIVYNSSNTNVWPITYPNVERFGIIGGGGEVHTLPSSERRDSTFPLAFYPFSTVTECSGTKMIPLKHYVTAGQTVSISVYMKKTHSMINGLRPKLHLLGAGVNTYTEMPDVNNEWTQVSIQGTALSTGHMNFWITAGVNLPDPASDEDILEGYELGTVKVYVDEYRSEITDG